MTFNEKIKSDIECLQRVLERLIANEAGDRAIAIVTGMLEGAKNFEEK